MSSAEVAGPARTVGQEGRPTGRSTTKGPSREHLDWWRTGAIYQVYIRSFADSNGDGTGDINGLRSKLPYLADLGIDGIWINPWSRPPARRWLRRSRLPRHPPVVRHARGRRRDDRRGPRVRDPHPGRSGAQPLQLGSVWFKAALSRSGSPERARFHLTEGSVADDGTVGPPNNWKSVFGGSAWTQVDDGQWYLHLFDPSQPDLDWTHPEVREEFRSILRFWLDRGADGFRVDVAHGLAKDMDFPDLADHVQILSSAKQPNHAHWDRDELQEIVREWRAVLDEYDGRMMVAEAWVSEESLPKYLRPDEYHQSFSFDLLMAAERQRLPLDDRQRLRTSQGARCCQHLGALQPRRHAAHNPLRATCRRKLAHLAGHRPSRCARHRTRRASRRVAALITLGLPGASYLYQGEELGLPEVWELPWDVLDDPVARRTKGPKGRDGCRVPIPWTADGESFGFGGPAWMPQPNGSLPMPPINRSASPARSTRSTRRSASAASTLSTTPN